jgi:hypothetical protein
MPLLTHAHEFSRCALQPGVLFQVEPAQKWSPVPVSTKTLVPLGGDSNRRPIPTTVSSSIELRRSGRFDRHHGDRPMHFDDEIFVMGHAGYSNLLLLISQRVTA